MDRYRLRSRQKKQKYILFDGAMGTMLYQKGIYINRCFDELNLSAPHLVREIHEAYIKAGADIITTNTFGANPLKLKYHGLDERIESINRAAVSIAREVQSDHPDVLIAGSMGPLGVKMNPFGRVLPQTVRELYRAQACHLIDGKVDLIILETFPSVIQLREAVLSVRDLVEDFPIIAQVTVNDDGLTLVGESLQTVVDTLTPLGVDAIGLNCSVGPAKMLDALKEVRQLTTMPLSAQPNAGTPKVVEDRLIYLSSPEYFAKFTKRFIGAGVQIVGGCCGTTPEHIQSMRRAILAFQPRHQGDEIASGWIEVRGNAAPISHLRPVHRTPLEYPSHFSRKLMRGEFTTCCEIDPPRGATPEAAIANARMLYQCGIDAITIGDGPRASARMNPASLALLFQREVGVDTVLHYCCRDRNILGMQSDLLGANAVGLKNILMITGDPPKLGDYPNATAVFDVDSIGLVRIADNLNHGVDLAGNPIGAPTDLFLAVGVNPAARDIDMELRRFEEKVRAGAQCALTQPVYEPELLERFMDSIKGLGIKVLLGILPLASYRNAEFLHNEVPGMKIPAPIRERLKPLKGKEAREEGARIAIQAIQEMRDMADGIYFMPPLGDRYETIATIMASIER